MTMRAHTDLGVRVLERHRLSFSLHRFSLKVQSHRELSPTIPRFVDLGINSFGRIPLTTKVADHSNSLLS